jgi:hypothetical protein
MIIGNRAGSTHLDRIRSFAALSDEVVIASPFLEAELDELLAEVDWNGVRRMTLITHLRAGDADQGPKVQAMVSLFDFLGRRGVDVRLHLDQALHGKLYLFRRSAAASAESSVSPARGTGAVLSNDSVLV